MTLLKCWLFLVSIKLRLQKEKEKLLSTLIFSDGSPRYPIIYFLEAPIKKSLESFKKI